MQVLRRSCNNKGILLFGNMSLIKKSILVYSLIIMLPVLVSGYYIYSGFQRSMSDEIRSGLQKNVDQITRDIQSRMGNVESAGNILTNEAKIRNFMALSREMESRNEKLYFDYVDSTLPLLKDALYFHSTDIFKISIYIDSSANADIIERGDIVFSDRRLLDFSWYRSLMRGSEDSVWLAPHLSKVYTLNDSGGNTVVFTLARKIFSTNGAYLGIAVLDMRQDDMLSSIISYNKGSPDNQVYIADDATNFILIPNQLDKAYETGILKNHLKGPNGYFYSGKDFYIFQKIDALGIYVVSKNDMRAFINSAGSTQFKIVLVFLAGLLLLIGITTLSIKAVFKRLQQIVSTMNSVARGSFDVRIPVERRDEVGQLTEDFNILIEKINALIKSVVDKETAQKDAQLLALQYQINPHFIYNMIDVFRMRMVLMSDSEAASAITDFGKLLRYNIGSQSRYSTLKDEIEYVRKYVNLQKFRYPDRIRLAVNLPEALEKAKIIRFILQPVVENSIRHGLTENVQAMDIAIDVEATCEGVSVAVTDNGSGMEKARLQAVSAMLEYPPEQYEPAAGEGGIGLANISRRLKLFYGGQCRIGIDSVCGAYTRIELTIPCE